MRPILIILLISFYNCSSIEVALSEYYNSSSPNDEWIELVVLEENANLSGYYLFDNGGGRNVNGWVGGLQFENHPLWQNLNKGTIIVINSRGDSALDTNKSDGYLEISAENDLYFSKIINSGSNWNAALNISQDGELIALMNDDEYVHILGHNPNHSSPGPLDSIFNKNSLITNSRLESGHSVRAIASNISEFIADYDSEYIDSGEINQGKSKGLPNSEVNSLLWRSLREPIWNNPLLEVIFQQDSLNFTFNSFEVVDQENSGYTLVAYENNNDFNLTDIPIDGKIYNVGDWIGEKGWVLKNLTSNQNEVNVSKDDFDCNKDYTFRLYAFNFSQDQLLKDSSPENARGRSYNELDFAETNYKFNSPQRPNLSSTTNNYLCDNSTVILTIDSNPSKIEWYHNGNLLENSSNTFIEINKSGNYYAVAYSREGCSTPSNQIMIEDAEKPIVSLEYNSEQITDSITFCKNSIVNIKAITESDYDLRWYRNSQIIAAGTKEINISEPGEYFLKVTNVALCSTYSDTITVTFNNYDLSFANNTYNYGIVDKSETQQIEIINNANSDFQLVSDLIEHSSNIIIDEKQFPLLIPSESSSNLSFSFTADDSGTISSNFSIFDYCKYSSATLTANIPEHSIALSKHSLSFQNTIPCNSTQSQEINLVEKNNLPFAILSLELSNNSVFKIEHQNNDMPILIDENSYKIQISFQPDKFGIFTDTLTIRSSSNNNSKNITESKVILNGSNDLVDFEILSENNTELEHINFGENLKCSSSTFSYELKIKNTGTKQLSILKPKNTELSFYDFPLLLPPGKDSIITVQLDSNSTNRSGYFLIQSELCELSKTITYSSSLTSITASTDDNIYSFGKIYTCNLSSNKNTLNVPVVFSGNSNKQLKLKKINTSQNILVNSFDSDSSFSVGDTTIFSFQAQKTFPDNTEKVSIEFEPCGFLEFEISATFQKEENISNLENNSTLDFGLVTGKELKTKILTFSNPYSDTLVITGYSALEAPFSILGEDLEFPLEIAPSASYNFEINYLQDIYSKQDKSELSFEISEPCTKFYNYSLIGSTSEEPLAADVFLQVGDNLSTNINQSGTFSIPFLYWSDHISAKELNLQSIDIKLEFNKSDLILLGDIPLNSSKNQLVEITEKDYGALISVQFKNYPRYDTLFKVKAKATFNSNISSDLKPSVVNAVYDGFAKFSSLNGTFYKFGFKSPSLLLIDNNIDNKLKDGSIVKNGSRIFFLGNAGFKTKISLFDYLGNEKILFDKLALNQKFSFVIDEPYGVYVLQYQVGNLSSSFRILIVNEN